MESTDKGLPFSNLLVIITSGILFGLGLSVSEMVNPARVLGFLNILGPWDPTLIFVMAGALTVAVPGFQYARLMHKPFLAVSFSIPGKKDLDKKLILGAVIFGIGWGLAGICPGPSLVALNSLDMKVVWFVLAMLAGIVAHDKFLPS
ncbi:YeeE/YedE family protein [Gammaproteobacteria bacterium]|jgi:uncharacterized membrane protein YedE/YeeE|nr:YeeE/YedE family protein [Gammaproteobacteria bacterium]MBT6042446.1 YeeE/YedE family protein [Gammaproteobacteria bacterium]MDA9908943.1 YeeE/YedE family protein [Gammaproteobacteria bacterium]